MGVPEVVETNIRQKGRLCVQLGSQLEGGIVRAFQDRPEDLPGRFDLLIGWPVLVQNTWAPMFPSFSMAFRCS